MIGRHVALLTFALGLVLAATGGAVPEPARSAKPVSPVRLRRPVAAAFLDAKTLCVVNQRSGSLSLVEFPEGRVRDEVVVGKHLSGLALLPDHEHLLTLDDEQNELLVLACGAAGVTVRARLPVADSPVSVAITADGRRAMVASLWSRRLEVFDLRVPGSEVPRLVHTLRLPFAPQLQSAIPGTSRLVVADAFAGNLALVDAAAERIVAIHHLPGHNIRGLAISSDGKQLLLAHQLLDQQAPTTRENLERGQLIANVVRSLPLDRLADADADLDAASRLMRLGTPGAGAGDPAGLAVVGNDLAVALAGVQQVALVRREDGKNARRLAVGLRPTVLVAAPEGQLVSINTFDDSLSLIDVQKGRVLRTVSLGASPELGPADRGELLFFDARLARDGWLSCHSCHSDGHTSGQLADTLGDNTYGTPKRILTLRGTALTDPWAWNGEMKYLQDQIEKSMLETMHARGAPGEQVNALLAYLHTLSPPPPRDPPGDAADNGQVNRGRIVFQQHGCNLCHIPPLTYSSHGTFDVGFADERGLRLFNPPSLRGVGQGYGFLHDNRARTLEELFTKYHHKVEKDLPEEDRADLLRFLRSL